MQEPTWPGYNLIAVTPSDSTLFTPAVRQLYVGVGGNVTVETDQGSTITFVNVLGGSYLGPFFIKRVKATGTTASNIVAFV